MYEFFMNILCKRMFMKISVLLQKENLILSELHVHE